MGLSFTIVAGPRHRGHSQVRVPLDSWPHFTVSDSRLPQPGGPGPHIYIPPEQSGPVIPPCTGFLFHRLLLLAGLRWRYSTTPPHWLNIIYVEHSSSIVASRSRRTYRVEKTASHLVHWYMLGIYCGHYPATAVVCSSGSACYNIDWIKYLRAG
jgi:hypothetical protein